MDKRDYLDKEYVKKIKDKFLKKRKKMTAQEITMKYNKKISRLMKI